MARIGSTLQPRSGLYTCPDHRCSGTVEYGTGCPRCNHPCTRSVPTEGRPRYTDDGERIASARPAIVESAERIVHAEAERLSVMPPLALAILTAGAVPER